MGSETLFYVAFIVDRDVVAALPTQKDQPGGMQVVLAAGVDLLAGPFVTETLAYEHMGAAMRHHALRNLTATLAQHGSTCGARVDVVAVNEARVARYNERRRHEVEEYNRQHPDQRPMPAALPWPPPVVAPERVVA
jgi:hypothetical protein